jgi:maltooligosyltrehalose trehalohydrolase
VTRTPSARDLSVWAPRAHTVELVLGRRAVRLEEEPGGWWSPPEGTRAHPGTDYGYRLDGEDAVLPDPRSRWQPHGVHGASRVFDATRHDWQDARWTGRQLAGSVIYELHIGTFTPAGTLDSAIDRLDHLVLLGIDFVELLPVNAFNGEWNWGYDGVLWYAVHEAYGGPAAYQRFVDACHARGLAVVQDVVYNHLGPSGNVLPRFGPYLHHARANTWGESVNLDGEDSAEVRRFILDNAAMWLGEYHVDALRLDAVHALVDDGRKHLLRELAEEVDALSAHLRRPLSLIAESDLNDPRLITARESGGHGLTAQWSDDYHHAVHVTLTRETTGYYADFDSLEALAKVLTHAYFHDGTYSSFRGREHGFPVDVDAVPSWRFVVFAQDHDQVGNRATGNRLTETLDERGLCLAAVLNLLSPFTPMLFMGEEWAASTPWQFFTSHPEPELGEATATGRIAEFERMGWDPEVVPDPQDPATFERSNLDWSELGEPVHVRMLEFYRALIALRRRQSGFTDPRFAATRCHFDEHERWFRIERPGLTIALNFADRPRRLPCPVGQELLRIGDAELGAEALVLGPRSAIVLELPQGGR